MTRRLHRTHVPLEVVAASQHPIFDADFEAKVVRVWALVGEAIAGATHALLGGDRELAKNLVRDDEVIDELVNGLVAEVTRALELGTGTPSDRRRLVSLVRTLPERMGEVAATIWRAATDTVSSSTKGSLDAVEELDDELDELHVSLTGELVSGSMPVPVAVEVAMVGRFYERFGDHAVNLANRQPGRSLVD